jgi:hypothetical protein
MSVVHRGKARADVEELANPGFTGQVPDGVRKPREVRATTTIPGNTSAYCSPAVRSTA